jgi:hypothetical protein
MSKVTHVKILNGRFRTFDVSGIFELAAPWKDTGKRTYVRVVSNDYLKSMHTTVGETSQIHCDVDGFYYCDQDGNEMKYSISNGTSKTAEENMVGEWEYKYREEETETEAMDRIRRSFSVLTEVTQACRKGVIRSAIVSGAPGIGKSYDVEEALKDGSSVLDDSKYEIIKGNMTPIMLFQILYWHRHEGHVIVFDDCDKVFEHDVSANLLKGALDTGKKRTIQWLSTGTELEAAGVEDKFDFEGSVMFLTNVDFKDIRDTKIGGHLKALKSRCLVLDLEVNSTIDMLRRIKQIMNDGLLGSFNFSSEVEWEIYEFVENNVEHLQELSLRTVIKVANLRDAFPSNWKDLSCQTVMKREAYYKLLYERRVTNVELKKELYAG